MATGINSDKMNQSKINLLDCVEDLNSLSNRLDNCYEDIQASLEGGCKSEVISKFGAIKREWPKVNQNINFLNIYCLFCYIIEFLLYQHTRK